MSTSRLPLTITLVPVTALRPDPANPRHMAGEEMESLCRSIREFGMVDPIIARRKDGLVIGGHQRLEAAKALGMESVPVVFLDVTDAQAKALNLALSKIHGDWDLPKLATVLEELRLEDIDFSVTGFADEEIEEIFGEVDRLAFGGEEEVFDAEGAMASADQEMGPTRVQPGEVWALGGHRLTCGDATDAAAWQRLMNGRRAHAVITDPPYGVGYVGGRRADSGDREDVYWDTFHPEEYLRLITETLRLAHRHSDDQAPLYLWFASARISEIFAAVPEGGWCHHEAAAAHRASDP